MRAIGIGSSVHRKGEGMRKKEAEFADVVINQLSEEIANASVTQDKYRSRRIAWKARALKAESEANLYFWLGLVLTVIGFLVGINVGLYAF